MIFMLIILLSIYFVHFIFIIVKIFYINTVFKLKIPKLYKIKYIILEDLKNNKNLFIKEKSKIKKIIKQLNRMNSKTLNRGSHIEYLFPKKQRVSISINFILKNNYDSVDPILFYIPEYPANLFILNQCEGGRHQPLFNDSIELFDYLYTLFGQDTLDWYKILYNKDKII